MTDVDEAWTQFKKNSESIAKASVNEKLDVLAAQLNEVQTDTKRLAEIVPKIMGDETAIDEANAGAMDPMAAMGGEMPPADAGIGGEEMPPEEGTGDEMMPEGEEMPPEEGAMPEEGAGELPPDVGGEEMPPEADVGADLDDELIGGDEDMEDLGPETEGLPELDEGTGGDNDVVETLKDALQEALDNDQMGLVSKIADAIAKLQGSSNGSEDILSGNEDVSDESISVADILGDEGSTEPPVAVGEESEGAEEETPSAEEPPASDSESESDDEVKKSAIAKEGSGAQGNPAPSGEPIDGAVVTEDTQVADSGTDEVKAKVMEAVAEGLDEALGTDEEIPAEKECEEESEEKNEEIAENPFEECKTMKSALKFAEHTSFRDLLSIKKSRHFGIDGKPALDAFKKMDNSLSQLDSESPDVAMVSEEKPEDADEETEEITLEDVDSAKDVTDAPDALEPGVRTEELGEGASEVDDGVVSEADQIDEVGEPINAGGTTEGLDTPVDNTTVDGLSEGDEEEDKELEEFGKSSTLDEVKDAKSLAKEGKSTDHGDLLDDVGEKKSPSGSAEPKPTITDDVDEKKGKGTAENPGDLLDDIDAKKGEGSAKNVPDMLDDVGHEKRATEHTVRPGTGLLDDVKEVKKSDTSENGKHIMSMKEMMAIRKSGQRPDAVTSTSGDITRPELGNPIRKTATEPAVKMGRGVDPHKVVENDWAEYKVYMAQKKL